MALKGINRKSDESKQHRITEKLSRMNIANFHEQLSDTANHFWSKFQTKNRIIQNSCKWIAKIMSINRNLLIFERFVYFNYKIYALLFRVEFACIFISFVINIAQCKSNNNQRDAHCTDISVVFENVVLSERMRVRVWFQNKRGYSTSQEYPWQCHCGWQINILWRVINSECSVGHLSCKSFLYFNAP